MHFIKYFLGVTFLLCFSTAGFSQTCENEFGFQMRTQEDVDNFQINYPGCKELLSPLNIAYDNSGITNLQGLAGIEIVRGDLYVANQADLVDLSPLGDIHTVEGYLGITESGVEEINLNNLQKVQNGIIIRNNPELQLIDGFKSLDSLGNQLQISNNEQLREINGFDSLKFTSTDLLIFQNDVLQEIDAFHNLIQVGEKLSLADNIDFKLLSGFEKLETLEIIFYSEEI